jgi:hypothetical protein
MAFVERVITVTFAMGGGAGGGGVTLSGLRVITNITVAGAHWITATANIFGMTLSHMNALTTVPWRPLTRGKNLVQIQAGDAQNGMSVVFNGTIMQAWPDMQSMPEVSFRVDANVGGWEKVNPKDPTSFSGPTKVSDVHAAIAQKLEAKPENNGVTSMISNPYMWGPPYTQMQQLARATRIGWILENGVCAIWPQQGSRTSAGQTVISPQTGMVGYPMAVPGGIVVRTLFNKAIAYASQFTVQSDITQANGLWKVTKIDLELDSQMPNGRWFALLYGTPIGN